jgi:hypothetical protein
MADARRRGRRRRHAGPADDYEQRSHALPRRHARARSWRRERGHAPAVAHVRAPGRGKRQHSTTTDGASTWAIPITPKHVADIGQVKIEAFFDGANKYGADDALSTAPVN